VIGSPQLRWDGDNKQVGGFQAGHTLTLNNRSGLATYRGDIRRTTRFNPGFALGLNLSGSPPPPCRSSVRLVSWIALPPLHWSAMTNHNEVAQYRVILQHIDDPDDAPGFVPPQFIAIVRAASPEKAVGEAEKLSELLHDHFKVVNIVPANGTL